MTKSNKKENGVVGKNLIKHSVAGTIIGMLITMATILIFAALMLTGAPPETLRDSLILVSVSRSDSRRSILRRTAGRGSGNRGLVISRGVCPSDTAGNCAI